MMINLEQGSREWLDWRQGKIGASDVPVIMGKSKFCSAYELWRRKIGFAGEQPDNWAMARGRQLETVVRDIINTVGFHTNEGKHIKGHFQPVIFQNTEIDWCIASLDGYDPTLELLVEIKVPGAADHETAKSNKVPIHYQDQLQWQLFCSDLTDGYYISYKDEDLAVVKVSRDDDYLAKEVLPKVSDFYRHIKEMTEPELSEDEARFIVDNPEFEEHARAYRAANELRVYNEKLEKFHKERLINLTDDGNCYGYGVRLTRCKRKGSTDWKKLYEDIINENPNLAEQFKPEAYTKKQIGYWSVKVD